MNNANNQTLNFFSISPVKTILWLRTDAIGDNVLASSMLPHIKNKFGPTKITVLCQEHVAPLYEHCPFVDSTITVNKNAFYQDQAYQRKTLAILEKLRFDLVLNSIYSRDFMTDLLAMQPQTKKRVAFHGNLCNITRRIRNRHNKSYDSIILDTKPFKSELEQHRNFLHHFGITVKQLKPIIWLRERDELWAKNFLCKQNFDPQKTIILFAGAQSTQRWSLLYGKALDQICWKHDLNVIAVGTQKEFDINQKNLDYITIKTVNTCGELTLQQTAALIKVCRLAVGSETGLAHIACATNTPNVILIGGGHFGRFMPYSPLTTLVSLPLSCYGCNWKCKYKKTYCLENLREQVLTKAIFHALSTPNIQAHIFEQQETHLKKRFFVPRWRSARNLIELEDTKIINVSSVSPKEQAC
ncbi:glycosyltransferase family 9 protein [Candidatus Babeliales bacterium]|nr:glycosyltransferase family 9 protein [Candidatus Babeliales bacterium]